MKQFDGIAGRAMAGGRPTLVAASLVLASSFAWGHVTLAPGGATAASPYEAAFRVGHACKDAQATTGITVRLPEGFSLENVVPRAGWTLTVADRQVSWQAASAQAALPHKERAEFVLRGRVSRPGARWFAVLQNCDQGSADWAQVPTEALPKPEFPAARLEVLPAGVAAVQVRGAWAGRTVAGRDTTGVFMTLSAPSGLRLLGASTPLAATAQIEEAATGAVPLRRVQHGVDLPPRELVELKPGGYQITLANVKQVLAPGAVLPLTLQFQDATGAPTSVTIEVPVVDPGSDAPSAQRTH